MDEGILEMAYGRRPAVSKWPMKRKAREELVVAIKIAIMKDGALSLDTVVDRVVIRFPSVPMMIVRDLSVLVLAGMDKRQQIYIEHIDYRVLGGE